MCITYDVVKDQSAVKIPKFSVSLLKTSRSPVVAVGCTMIDLHKSLTLDLAEYHNFPGLSIVVVVANYSR